MGRRKQKGGNFKGTRRQRGKKQEGGLSTAVLWSYASNLRNKIGEKMIAYGNKMKKTKRSGGAKTQQKGGIVSFRGYPNRIRPFPRRHFFFYQ